MESSLKSFLTLNIIGFNESRDVESVKDSSTGETLYLAAVSGSQKSSIDIQTPGGKICRIPVDALTLDGLRDEFPVPLE
jgi:hypothetical protein